MQDRVSYYRASKTTTKGTGTFVVPQVAPKEERRVLVRERRFEGRDGVLGTGAAPSLKGGYQGVLPNEDSMASWRLSSRRMVCELSHAACQPRMG